MACAASSIFFATSDFCPPKRSAVPVRSYRRFNASASAPFETATRVVQYVTCSWTSSRDNAANADVNSRMDSCPATACASISDLEPAARVRSFSAAETSSVKLST